MQLRLVLANLEPELDQLNPGGPGRSNVVKPEEDLITQLRGRLGSRA
jgi:hypothetical protein